MDAESLGLETAACSRTEKGGAGRVQLARLCRVSAACARQLQRAKIRLPEAAQMRGASDCVVRLKRSHPPLQDERGASRGMKLLR